MLEKFLTKFEKAKQYTALLYSGIEVTSMKFDPHMFGHVPQTHFKVPEADFLAFC